MSLKVRDAQWDRDRDAWWEGREGFNRKTVGCARL